MSIDSGKQFHPEGDARYRVHKSVKCYVASMRCGREVCTLFLDNWIERVIRLFPDGSRRVLYEGGFYLLQTPDELEKKFREHLALKWSVVFVNGHYEPNQRFEPYHFIDITSRVDVEKYQPTRQLWMKSGSFQGILKLNSFDVKNLTWDAIQQKHKDEIVQLLKIAGEVEPKGLETRLRATNKFAIVLHEDAVAGRGALKSPLDSYRKKVFDKSKAKLAAADYPIELGYIAVSGKMRSQGIGPAITKSLLENLVDQQVYATTKSTNRKMQTILLRNGFICVGEAYKPERGNYSLLFWTRDV